jgi:hypothetical protein
MTPGEGCVLMTMVWIYVNTSKEVGDVAHLKVFANEAAAEQWFAENDPEGVAFEYEVIPVDEILMTTTDILDHMRNGARLFRGVADQIELTLSEGQKFEVPLELFDSLIDEHKIVSESGEPNGLYRLSDDIQ